MKIKGGIVMKINRKLCLMLSAAMLILCACGAAFAKEAAHERRIRLATRSRTS